MLNPRMMVIDLLSPVFTTIRNVLRVLSEFVLS